MSDDEKNSSGSKVNTLDPLRSKLKTLKSSRSYVRQRVTKSCDKVNDQLPSVTELNRSVFTLENLNKLKALETEIVDLDRKIFGLCIELDTPDSTLQQYSDENESYTDKLASCIAQLTVAQQPPVNPQPQYLGSLEELLNSHKLTLPEVPLPEFGNEPGESLEKFIRLFESIIDKHKLTSQEKFMYLRKQLSNGPRVLINALDIDNQLYEHAIKLLKRAFGAAVTSKSDLVKKLSSMKMEPNADPYPFIGDILTVIESVKSTKITVEDICRHFIWEGLNEDFQNHMTHITNKSKPTLDEIDKNVFEAAVRYTKALKSQKNKSPKIKEHPHNSYQNKDNSSNAMAINIKPKGKVICILCSKDKKACDHFLKDCKEYDSPKKRFDKLRTINACTRCAFPNHVSKDCRFSFRSNCRACNGPHFTYLCISPKNERVNTQAVKVEESPESEVREVKNTTLVIKAFQNNIDDNMILPTFSAHLDVGDNLAPVRIFKDTGCQRTFICSSVADALNLPVIERNVPLKIHGFNSIKMINTNIVSVNLKVNKELHELKAIVVDSIGTEFCIDGLSEVIDHFTKCNYKIADQNYLSSKSRQVNNIDIILGTDADHVLDLQFKTFGLKNCKSSFIDSPIGVIFSGSVDRMIRNLPCLPNFDPKFNTYEEKVNIDTNVLNRKCMNCVPISSSAFSSISNIDEPSNDGFVFDKPKEVIPLDIDLEKSFESMIDLETHESYDPVDSETNMKLIQFTLDNSRRAEDGRMFMRILWNCKNSHLLAKNYKLALSILKSNFEKLSKEPIKLEMYNDVIKEQENLGVIEKIQDIEGFMETHPECAFLAHTGVFRMNHDSTKCRVVLLSNLAEKGSSPKVSHNQAILAGPNLNHNICTAVMLLRFGKFLLTYDIKKAFLNIGLEEEDQNRLLFLWYNNVEKKDYRVVGYKNKRLPFGLKCSPAILMLSLFTILMLASPDDPLYEFKRSLYSSIYMDNGSFSCESESELVQAYGNLIEVYEPYKFKLQQFSTNSQELDSKLSENTPESNKTANSKSSENTLESNKTTKLFGMRWDCTNDAIAPFKIDLDINANSRRSILGSVSSVYDIFNIYAPLLLRSRLFVQKLQSDKSLGWDTVLSDELIKEWKNIVKQANSAPQLEIARNVGPKNGEYQLIAYSDASKSALGVVIYIKNINENKACYLASKYKLVSLTCKRTMPVLELQALCLGVEFLMATMQSLSGDSVVCPVNIKDLLIFSDSLVCLHWLQSNSVYFEKLTNLSVFAKNRLRIIEETCRLKSVTFRHTAGDANPSDVLTRPCGMKRLNSSRYLTGPTSLTDGSLESSDFSVTIPNPICRSVDEVADVAEAADINISSFCAGADIDADKPSHVVPIDKYSRLDTLLTVTTCVLRFINKLKNSLNNKTKSYSVNQDDMLRGIAMNRIISTEQKLHYPEVFDYLNSNDRSNIRIPQLINQLNLYKDGCDVLRVKGKFPEDSSNPILLPKESTLTSLVIRATHEKLAHAGLYPVLRELRKHFWIVHFFSCVNKILKKCITCRRFNEPAIKLNQNKYREYRIDPPKMPFAHVFMDYLGPFIVKFKGEKQKVWLLAITCLYSRAVNIKICQSLNLKDMMRAVQMHCMEYGIFQSCVSDLGSQLQAGANLLRTFLSDPETLNYFQANKIKKMDFQHYAKGNSSLGSIIESCVKQIKFLIFKSIRNVILDFFDFEFLVLKAVSLINKRPIGFKDGLRSLKPDEVPTSITPEMLIRGYETVTVNVIPELQPLEDKNDPDIETPTSLGQEYEKLRNVRERLIDLYHSEFLTTLLKQSLDKKDRYKPLLHKPVKPGDVVLLVDKSLKRYHYPMGRVVDIEINSLGEVTSAWVIKGDTQEKVYRHVTSLVLLIPYELTETEDEPTGSTQPTGTAEPTVRPSTSRRAALACRDKNKSLSTLGVV